MRFSSGGNGMNATILAAVLGSSILLGVQTQLAFGLVNAPPTVDQIPDQVVDELILLSFTATAYDPDGQILTFSLQNAPYGATINPATGTFTWIPGEEQGPGVYSVNVVASDGFVISSETVLIIVNGVNDGGGGSNGSPGASEISPGIIGAGLGETGLYADPSSIPLDGTSSLTQLSDPVNNGELMSLTVLEPDGDICAATGLSSSIPSEGLSKEYPTDFALLSNGGDGICDTGEVGTYHAQSQVNTEGGQVSDTVEFETQSPFVLPESPIGIVAMMVSSLAVLAAFAFMKGLKARTNRMGF